MKNFVLRKTAILRRGWTQRLLGIGPVSYTYRIPERDEAGALALAAIENQGVSLVADALAQSVDHILGFFFLLRYEIGFYLAGVQLNEALTSRQLALCWPRPAPPEEYALSCRSLYDISLALRVGDDVVGNDLDTDGATLIMITGANQGGKSTLLRSLVVAQLMLQAGLFVPPPATRRALQRPSTATTGARKTPAWKAGSLTRNWPA